MTIDKIIELVQIIRKDIIECHSMLTKIGMGKKWEIALLNKSRSNLNKVQEELEKHRSQK